MRKTVISLFVLGVVAAGLHAATVNPTSNVLGDTAGSADTLVLRNASGDVDANTLLANESIITAHIKTSSVITAHTHLDLPSAAALCVKTNKKIGYCSTAVEADGECTCN